VELRNGETVRQLIGDGQATAVHDVSDGGLLVALAEMAMASGLGVKLEVSLNTAQAFGEDQSRYIVTTKPDTALEGAVKLGVVGGFDVAGVAVSKLKAANEAFFKDWMEG
jgi:phosphoribosylformylglycinamidine synthase